MKRILFPMFLFGVVMSTILIMSPASAETAVSQTNVNSEIYLPIIQTPADPSWFMAGGNPQRTSWTSTEVPGNLRPTWYRPIEAYIPQKVQIVAANGLLFVSTAKGLYTFNAETGAEGWVYPTEMSLGHSPTVVSGVAYVGGYDKKIHAINANNGQGIWTFEAGAGFQTNPLVVNNTVYMGSRDGFFYAVNAQTGQLKWKYETDGPILFSAAYQSGIVYFASNDSYAYALNSETGGLIWRSAKLPGAGFNSFWPVVYEDRVILISSRNYRGIAPGKFDPRDAEVIFPNRAQDAKGALIGPMGNVPYKWVAGTPTIDMSKANTTANGSTYPFTEFLELYPDRRTVFVLNRFTGTEYSYDFDNDGKKEYAPISFTGGATGTIYPPIVGGDGVLYFQNMYMSSKDIPGGHITGWKLDTPIVSVISSDWGARDEPHAYIGGGNDIYWNLCCDRQAGAIDLSTPNTMFQNNVNNNIMPPTLGTDMAREPVYFAYNLPQKAPGYNIMTYVWPIYNKPMGGVYGGYNGVYGWHHDGNPPIPYNDKVYFHGSNAIFALKKNATNPTALPLTEIVDVQDPTVPVVSKAEMGDLLATEVQKMIDTGHLLPGYAPGPGKFDFQGARICGEDLMDYWHHPADTLYVLLRALPHLPANMQAPARAYIQSEFNAFPPYQYNHIGWQTGTPRDNFKLPPDVANTFADHGPETSVSGFAGWNFNPFAFYSLWLYAEEFGGAAQIFTDAKGGASLMSSFNKVPSNDVLAEMPFVHNAYIAGYIGYINLAQLAGSGENLSGKQATLNSLLSLRASTFSKDAPAKFYENGSVQYYYCRALNVSRNFMFLTPELAAYLRTNAYGKVNAALNEYQDVAPLWYVTKPEVAFGEGVRQHLYDVNGIFQAKAMILQEPHSELGQYVDVPAFEVGDLFYILNLVSGMEAAD
ncbi:MAG: PQQ-binding-like beta-propeller repeat protein [Chloroflexi bacterium]|nr:PQQ-binding-like beta-propeller repeat protein [Chloroflexota bacterium]